jgi:hypothetical protein
MNEQVAEQLRREAREGRVACPVARKIAEDLDVPYADVGQAANDLGIKIVNCDLGCF